MDRVLYVLVTLVESVLGIFGVRALYEQPAYTVVERLDRGVEIRSYAPRLAVETDSRGQGDGEAFGRLFRYITGANRGGDRIAMTAPVETGGRRIAMTVPVEQDGAGTMRFFLPRGGGGRGARADRAGDPAGRDPGRTDRGVALLRPSHPGGTGRTGAHPRRRAGGGGTENRGRAVRHGIRSPLRDPVPAQERGGRPAGLPVSRRRRRGPVPAGIPMARRRTSRLRNIPGSYFQICPKIPDDRSMMLYLRNTVRHSMVFSGTGRD